MLDKRVKKGYNTKVKYNIILADPPWNFKVWSDKGKDRSAEKHYPVMTKEAIQALPIQNIAADDCTLFLWVTFPCLLEGIELIKAWGFEYKTVGFTWVKKNKKSDSLFMGLGYWTRCLGGKTKVTLLDTKEDKIFEEKLENLNKYNFNLFKIWSHSGWKKIIGITENSSTLVSKIKTNIGDIYCSNNHTWVYKKVIRRRIGSKKVCNIRKTEHVIVEDTLENLFKDYNGSYVNLNRYSVNLLYPEFPKQVQNPVLCIDGIYLDEKLGYIVGLFCAEGNYVNNPNRKDNQVRFSLHAKEINKYEYIRKYIEGLSLKNERYFRQDVKVHMHKTRNANSMSVYFASKKIKDIIKKFIVGEGAHHKRLNLDLLLKTSVEFRKTFIKGMLEGDGFKNLGEYWRLTLCNKELILDFIKLMNSVGILASYREDKPQYKNNTLCYKYTLQIYNRNRKHNFKLENFSVRTVEIKDIKKDVGRIKTFDISVEGGLFVANNLITHNSNSELCLIATRGKPKRVDKGVHSVIISPVEEHSKKPDEVRDRIVKLMGDIPRIELFARQTAVGWTAVGNEVCDTDIKTSLEVLGVTNDPQNFKSTKWFNRQVAKNC